MPTDEMERTLLRRSIMAIWERENIMIVCFHNQFAVAYVVTTNKEKSSHWIHWPEPAEPGAIVPSWFLTAIPGVPIELADYMRRYFNDYIEW